MAMLAEQRRKRKWSVDPRNSAWSNDDSKFGQKMLERMGWSKGKGLGRSEQGSTDHIKVKVKNDNHGLGANASHEDNWIAHQDEFNELLAQLNNHHGQNNEAPSDERGFSLEEKSKTAKKRVHYMKFTKGKDLSSRSETDLNCIFGKRTKSANDQEQESSKHNSSDESEASGTTPPEQDAELITKTVTSSLSMQEYFAQRMAQLKKSRGAETTAPSADDPTQELSLVNSGSGHAEEPKKKKKKKNKKLVEVVEDESAALIVVDDTNMDKEKSRKKRKLTDLDSNANENCSFVLEEKCQELCSSKNKKLKKRAKKGELLNGHDKTVECELIQDEKNNHKEVDVEEECNEPVVKKSKKKKRKKNH
ncbi:PIN2/TERF1-interacting telomerase inhibitor 1 [Nematolebias whitei]|uniref:PIN2/TERF1-interacting telomerase inhibitor 1 n=1 Tax=Nematolebias whitei TaxID=451745 RepID=UPI00189B723B|nr:PIN2/TERF1-interacting telomerase inhibitor 1 [Nematolebias whitei]